MEDAKPGILLSVRNLSVDFPTPNGPFHAVEDVSFDVREGAAVAVVGESGSGKSITMRALMRLVPRPGRIVGGALLLGGRDLRSLSGAEMVRLRGSDIALISQDPLASWNPVLRIGRQIGEAVQLHAPAARRSLWRRVVSLLRNVGIPAPEVRANAFPHELSGGMRQRAMIAMGIANAPRLLLADEPTTALDVTVQDQIIRLLRQVREEEGTAIILVTHNLAVVASLCDEVVVMYAGRVMEIGSTDLLFASPLHPYTEGLLRSVPRLDASEEDELYGIPGRPIDPGEHVAGCKFHPRCVYRIDRCASEEPPLADYEGGRKARCWLPEPARRGRAAAADALVENDL